jgi:MFS family permease
MALQMGLNSNFVGQEMALKGLQQGVLEACRESCGIFALGLLALLAAFAEPLIGAAMLVLLAIGLGAYTFVSDYAGLILASLLWSQGLHVWMPLPGSMTLALAEPGRAGYRLGQMAAAGAVGSAVGLVAAYFLIRFEVSAIRPLYLVAGAAALAGSAACLGIPRRMKAARPRLVFRREYGLYYLLTFLEGWRKQICIAFAGFLLVTQYDTPLTTMLLLSLVTQAISWFLSPLVGKVIDRVGERRALVFYYASMAVVFSGYILVEDRRMLYALFVLDNAFFAFTMALTTYVNRIAPKSEHTATLSMGVAMNHVAAVAMPLTGGLLWRYAGYRWAFLTGVAAAALSIVVASFLPRHGGKSGDSIDVHAVPRFPPLPVRPPLIPDETGLD